MTENGMVIADVCAFLGCKRWTVYRLIREEGFPKPYNTTYPRLWNPEAVREYVEQWKSEHANDAPHHFAPREQWPVNADDLANPAYELEGLIASRQAFPNVNVACGIYFLFMGDEVVYVGQSIANVLYRIAQHVGAKEFDGFTIIPCDERVIDHLEAHFIWKFRPRYNGKRGETFRTNVKGFRG